MSYPARKITTQKFLLATIFSSFPYILNGKCLCVCVGGGGGYYQTPLGGDADLVYPKSIKSNYFRKCVKDMEMKLDKRKL